MTGGEERDEHLLDDLEARGLPRADVLEERLQRSEPLVSRSRLVPPPLLEVLQELEDGRRVPVLQAKRPDVHSALTGAVVDEEPQRRRIALDGLRARAALDRKVLDEEALDQPRQRGLVPFHSTVLAARTPARRSMLPVMRWLNSGTADRYQYVLSGFACPR